MIPMGFLPVVDPRFLHDRIRQLEQALVLQSETIQAILQRLESKFGNDFLGPDLQQMTACLSEADAKLILKSIDSFIANCDKPAATRQVREEYGCTWDEALSVVANWNSHSLETKIRALRLARFIVASKAIHQTPTETIQDP